MCVCVCVCVCVRAWCVRACVRACVRVLILPKWAQLNSRADFLDMSFSVDSQSMNIQQNDKCNGPFFVSSF